MENVHHDLQNQTSENLNNGQLIDSELSKNKSNLSHNLDGIPIITDCRLLLEVLYAGIGNGKISLNITKKIYSTYEACDRDPGAREDFEKISNVFSASLNSAVKGEDWIVEMKDKEKLIRALRNSFTHDNYFSLSAKDGLNYRLLEKLREKLTSAQQQKLDQYDKSKNWILWNLDSRSKNLVFCCIISNEVFWKFIKVFLCKCIEIIEKSKENC
jgi:hypothetical protein